MSYRPTLSIYLNHRLSTVFYLRNFSDEDLFHEAIALSALSCDPAYRKFLDEWNDEDGMNEEILQCSEFPVVLDLDASCIYVSYEQLTPEEIASLDQVTGPVRDYHDVLERCAIPCSHSDPYSVLELYTDNDSLFRRLSSYTADMISFFVYKHHEALMLS